MLDARAGSGPGQLRVEPWIRFFYYRITLGLKIVDHFNFELGLSRGLTRPEAGLTLRALGQLELSFKAQPDFSPSRIGSRIEAYLFISDKPPFPFFSLADFSSFLSPPLPPLAFHLLANRNHSISISSTLLAPMAAPLMAKKVRHEMEMFGDIRVDDYFWLCDDSRSNPKVLSHLKPLVGTAHFPHILLHLLVRPCHR